MPLTNLHVKNWFKDEFTNNSSTSLILPVTAGNAFISSSGQLVQNGDTQSYLNPNVLARAVKLEISVQNGEYQEGENGDWGYYSVCIRDISISGYSGALNKTWATNTYPQNVSQGNPLYHTEYQPGIGQGMLLYGSAISTLNDTPYDVPGGWMGSSYELGYQYDNDGNVLNGTANRSYKVFTQAQTELYGDQSLQDYITEYGGTNNATGEIEGLVPQGDAEVLTWEATDGITIDGYWYQQIETAQGEWFNPETNVVYVDQAQSSTNQWNPVVEKVIMFDTIGFEYVPGAGPQGLQNNTIDVFVIFKDVQAAGYLNFDTINNVVTNPTYGITINTSLADGGAWYETGNGVVHIDFDGVPKWTRVLNHPPEDDNTGDTNVGDTGNTTFNDTNVDVVVDENSEDNDSGVTVILDPFDITD